MFEVAIETSIHPGSFAHRIRFADRRLREKLLSQHRKASGRSVNNTDSDSNSGADGKPNSNSNAVSDANTNTTNGVVVREYELRERNGWYRYAHRKLIDFHHRERLCSFCGERAFDGD
jgi:hypothetical protein